MKGRSEGSQQGLPWGGGGGSCPGRLLSDAAAAAAATARPVGTGAEVLAWSGRVPGSLPTRDPALHLVAGGLGGTAGAILTCPLEVVKTRLQASPWVLRPLCLPAVELPGVNGALIRPGIPSEGILRLLRSILEKEGIRSLFRGLGPNLIGVAPSRAIYFAAYSQTKEKLNTVLVPESKKVHMLSAACAGVTSATLTNPIWLVKTRMQLEARAKGESCTSGLQCAMRVYHTEGLRGFYRGITASYAGVSETIIHFVIYEALKQRLRENQPFLAAALPLPHNSQDFCGLMVAAAISKLCASCIAYPHEVIRTRLREEGSRYLSFVQTLQLVVREEGPSALYRGLLPHLMRQIPNAAIVMVTYELVIHLARKM
ncbi:solute carrier family 25 member 33-like [Sceloporus undulatus]|uniref:solute carrier family 25 member 33-like n=1 Tax=Sceloporus undulatus TaxID=8520 RepID=UPI001C4CA144|nr:solute carrier family 25 member 33-like [Sceloporus undulatus]